MGRCVLTPPQGDVLAVLEWLTYRDVQITRHLGTAALQRRVLGQSSAGLQSFGLWPAQGPMLPS